MPDDWITIVWFPGGAGNSLIFCNVQTISLAYPASYHMCTAMHFMVGIQKHVHLVTGSLTLTNECITLLAHPTPTNIHTCFLGILQLMHHRHFEFSFFADTSWLLN